MINVLKCTDFLHPELKVVECNVVSNENVYVSLGIIILLVLEIKVINVISA